MPATIRRLGCGYSGKTDLNFNASRLFDGKDWRDRKAGQPFFAQITLGQTHRQPAAGGWSGLRARSNHPVDPSKVELPPYFPDHPVCREDWAKYLDAMEAVDAQVGDILQRLNDEGIADNTVVIFSGDNGRCHLRGKCWLYEGGIHVPLIVRWPRKIEPHSVNGDLVSMIDVTATILEIAGVPLPDYLDGHPILGSRARKRECIFAARDLIDEVMDHIRCVRTDRYKYIRNYTPENGYHECSYVQNNRPMLAVMRELQVQGKLNDAQQLLLADVKPAEELYDLQADPHELHNLATSAEHQQTLSQLRKLLDDWIEDTGDKGLEQLQPTNKRGEPLGSELKGNLFRRLRAFRFEPLRLAINNLAEAGQAPVAARLLDELSGLQREVASMTSAVPPGRRRTPQGVTRLEERLERFRRRALLRHPAVQDLRVLCVRRNWRQGVLPENLTKLGIPSNHECHSSLPPAGFENELALFHVAAPAKTWTTLYRPGDGGWIGDAELHWDADRVLFSMSDGVQWNLWEMRLDGTGLRRITHTPPDVSCFDPCYLPDGRILCASDATGQCVPCWHGVARKSVANLFVMNGDGSDMRRITFDQDHDMHPAVLANGQVVYNRWDYTGINRVFLRPLMIMNPDGTGQRSLYGSNSWFPNGLYSPRELPEQPGKLLCILAGYHGPGRTGHLVVVDTNRGRQEGDGIVKHISGTGEPLKIKYMDEFTTSTWPKFHASYPITDKQFLVSAWMSLQSQRMGIYLADIFDNLLLLYEIDGAALLDPIPVVARPVPPVIPDQTLRDGDDATVYLQDVYAGAGLVDVPRGTVRRLRVIAYNFGYVGLAGNDKIGLSGPWEAMRILGTTPVQLDGSALFRIPANTPVAFQALDAEGKAVQLMRTWLSARPGERLSCVGCHEPAGTAPALGPSLAAAQSPRSLDPWYGPPRGFDFAREVQPVLNRYCVSCHDGSGEPCDLRAEELVTDYRGRLPGRLDLTRLRAEHLRSLAAEFATHRPTRRCCPISDA